MADKTKTATSRSLDYAVSGDILDRLKDAARSKHFDAEGKYRGSGLGRGIDTIHKTFKDKAAEFKSEKEKEEAEAKLAQDKRDVGEVNFDNSFEKLGERGSWTTPYVHGLFTENEQSFKKKYLDAVESGDKVLANQLLNEQNTRYSSITSWKEAINGASSIQNGTKSGDEDDYMGEWSQTLLKDPSKMHLIEKINDQGAGSGVTIHTDDENEVYFEIPVYDPTANNGMGGDHPTEKRKVTLKDYQDLTNQLVDKKFEGIWTNELTSLYQGASNGDIKDFDFDKNMGLNSQRIKKGNIEGLFYDKVFGLNRSFVDDLITHPDFTSGPGNEFKPNKLSNIMATKNPPQELFLDGHEFTADQEGTPDGYLDHEEILNMSEADKRKLADILLAKNDKGQLVNFDIAQQYLSEWMTLMQDQNFKKGKSSPRKKRYDD